MKEKVIYYSDELNDEFSGTTIKARIIDEKFPYKKSKIWEFFSILAQNVLSVPIKYLYLKIKFHHKFIGKEKLKECRNRGYFIYTNHTQNFADTFISSMANFPKRNFLIVNPENISVKGTGWIVELLGAIPLPTGVKAHRNFLNEIQFRISKKQSITIMPEAHIWPYYTKIRNFKSASFKYPAQLNCPIYTVTNVYLKRDDKEKCNMITYIDGPFYADGKNIKEKQENIRDKAYKAMCKRAKESNYEKIKYIRR